MASFFSLPDLSAGSSEEKAARINQVLGEIHDVLTRDEDVSKRVRYHVKERGENDRIRLAKIFAFKEPDRDTMTVLNQNFASWEASPHTFWTRPAVPMPCPFTSIALQSRIVRRLLCVLLEELRILNRGISTGETAKMLNELDAANYQYDEVESTVEEMLRAGSRYRNLENALGHGVLFVLGKDISETL
ncbi:uncharacterized protein Z518_00393 [Rhinocladiella mackenziei CBS 650.93]|uniref:Uncharacterized protein n=1 Tax=Rhinocladiella mackenziei CBS 650.93 TaxID=1442369 RepID=A0A0D2ITD3_9EURO|nr:uncharacterized protein Z518_00393 [Rhinocladiella mackenziei CBS 650.93]KIX09314.1 hypothetical protein Z518_00393 [Rhinocladiella mackenziei CBS 650.93]